MPFEDFSGVGDDSVIARLQFDVPEGEAQQLAELSRVTESLRTTMEAITKQTGDYLEYLKELPQIQKEIAKAQEEVQRSVETGRQTQEAVEQVSTPRAEPTLPDISEQMQRILERREQLEELDDSRLLEMLGERGLLSESLSGGRVQHRISLPNGSPIDASQMGEDAARDRILDALAHTGEKESGNLLDRSQMIGDLLGGAMDLSRAGTVGDALKRGRGLLGGMSGGGGAVAGMAGRAVPYVGAAMMGYELMERGFDQYDQYKTLGQVRGGGASEGLGYEMQIRSMAMNPFINTEQARKIMMTGLNEGYSGRELETVTEYMAPQPLSSKILTPYGWTTMGEVEVDSKVIGLDGQAKTVHAIQDWGEQDVYELTLQNGTKVRSSLHHKWYVYSGHSTTPLVLTVEEMLRGPKHRGEYKGYLMHTGAGSMDPRYRIPYSSPVHFEDREVEIDPYLIGLLLGDGSLDCSLKKGGVTLCSFDEQDYEVDLLPEGVSMVRKGSEYIFPTTQWVGSGSLGHPLHPLKVALSKIGLLGRTHRDKFIPELYKYNSVEKRFALLQGLIDTDGCIDTNGNISFCSTTPELVEGVREIVHSLGGRTHVSWSDPTGHPWESKKLLANVAIKLPTELGAPARLLRKSSRYKVGFHTERRRSVGIVSIEFVGREEVRCINVDDSLYLTDGYTVTHNSNLKDMNMEVGDSMKLMKKNVDEGGQSIEGLNSQLEMLKNLGQDSNTSLKSMQDQFTKVSGAGVDLGMGGGEAGAVGMTAANLFQGEIDGQRNPLAGRGGDIVGGLMGSQQLLGLIAQQRGRGERGYMMPDVLGDQLPSELFSVLKSQNDRVNPRKDPYIFMNYLRQMGLNLTLNEAASLQKQLDMGNPADAANRDIEETATQYSENDAGFLGMNRFGQQTQAYGGAALGGTWDQIKGVGRGLWALLPGGMKPGEAWESYKGDLKNRTNEFYKELGDTTKMNTSMWNPLIDRYGAKNLQWVDAEGNKHDYSPYDMSEDVLSKLASGEYKVATKSGELGAGVSFKDIARQGASAGEGQSGAFGSISGSVKMDLTDRAAQVFKTVGGNNVPLTQGQVQSLSGYGGRQLNNVPPGDPMSSGRR